ncbi:MAG: protein of unknown function DUF427, partial [uncultured Sphingomonadaceae bacterium]
GEGCVERRSRRGSRRYGGHRRKSLFPEKLGGFRDAQGERHDQPLPVEGHGQLLHAGRRRRRKSGRRLVLSGTAAGRLGHPGPGRVLEGRAGRL